MWAVLTSRKVEIRFKDRFYVNLQLFNIRTKESLFIYKNHFRFAFVRLNSNKDTTFNLDGRWRIGALHSNDILHPQTNGVRALFEK